RSFERPFSPRMTDPLIPAVLAFRDYALSGNDSRSGNWQAQQQRGAQSRQLASRNQPQRQASGARPERREFRHR
ncbi:hypothetical protein, partial [Enterobacter sp.]|uniref:hypothetical protein n=1 Tax=Enterobacter sp. TaxID=42895 RepID=UPI0039E46838